MSEYFIGLMSGTSLDGIDAVILDCASRQIKLIETYSAPYPENIKTKVRALNENNGLITLQEFGSLDVALGNYYAETVISLLNKSKFKPKDICAIGSHGQTIFHSPKTENPFSMQIGSGSVIAAKTDIACINDFRSMDVALGGQGAPLAPAFHQALLASPDENRMILNLGGIANITLLPNDGENIIGYDTGPANTLMDIWIQKHLNQKYDENGQWAASGNIQPALLEHMISDPYFRKEYPKSTGTEYFNLSWLESSLASCKEIYKPEDVQATLCELTAQSIAAEILKHDTQNIYLCGGGANNKHLIARLENHLPNIVIQITSALGIDPQWVEASCFAWLAHQYVHKLPGNIPSVTGATKPAVLGCLYQP
ncbi:anhydro-N-acetylmuramic acid kinase [Francisellaceae bacterium]|nr:anhydro-N-acetylmuramic acid kinase [Francisellaceae bacterium]